MANRFAFLEIEGDDSPSVQQPSVKKEAKAAAATPAAAVAPSAAASKKDSALGKSAAGGVRTNGNSSAPRAGSQATRKVYRGDGAGQDSSAQTENTKHVGDSVRGSSKPRGRGTRGRPTRPDRHSQTGRTDSDKQEHQGWAGDDGRREMEQEQQAEADAKADQAQSGAATPAAADGTQTPATPARPVEEEDNTQSYVEYLAAKTAAGAQSLAEKLGLTQLMRQANEGADDSQWKESKKLEKETDAYFAGEAKDKGRKRAPKEGKTYLEADISYPRIGGDRPERGRGGARGGRGEGRGGRGGRGGERSAPRGDRANGSAAKPKSSQAQPDLSESAFPSLS